MTEFTADLQTVASVATTDPLKVTLRYLKGTQNALAGTPCAHSRYLVLFVKEARGGDDLSGAASHRHLRGARRLLSKRRGRKERETPRESEIHEQMAAHRRCH